MRVVVGVVSAVCVGMLLLLAGCPAPVEKRGLMEVGRSRSMDLSRMLDPGAQDMTSWTELTPAVTRSLEYVRVFPPQKAALVAEELTVTWGELAESLERLLAMLPRLDEDPDLLARSFTWYELRPGPLFTGYYEPLVPASLEPDPEYPHPIYGLPEDLKQADLGDFHPRWQGQRLLYRVQDGEIVPYFERSEIDGEGALHGQGLEVAWARDLVDVFFLQIQGSGRLLLPDGSMQRIQYAGKNGRQYVSLGRILVERGHLPADGVSMQAIRKVLAEHPEEMAELLHTNPSYVFFRLEQDGPYGAMGKVVTPMVSLATDPKVLPLGALTVVDLGLPVQGSPDRLPFVGIGLPQDTGGAITGHRVDLFCGSGPRAEHLAGHLQDRGKIFVLLPHHQNTKP
ncbi:MAG: murein transglycosylase A [Desulfohalobiaceae bacterium]